MAKVVFGEFGAFNAKNSIRYTKNNKMTSESSLPPEVVAYLQAKLHDLNAVETELPELPKQKFPRPSEEEIARMRAESLQVKPELQATPEKLAEDAEALTADDFDVEEPTPTTVDQADTEPSADQMHDVSTALAPDSNGNAPLPRATEPAGLHPVPTEPDFLETVSIHTASLQDITRALYERFGIYTVYLRELPQPDEINPLTGEPFTKYHQGIAYQAAIGAQNRGILDRPAEEGRRIIDEGRTASANFRVDEAPRTMGDARRANSFDFRTSVNGNQNTSATEVVHITDENGVVHAVQRDIPKGQTGEFNGASSRYDAEEDEQLVEPRMGKQVIRPNW